MIANTGTYLDAPAHRFADGPDVAGLALARTADLESVVVPAPDRRRIDTGVLGGIDVGGRAVLLHTGWDRHWRSERYGIDAP